MIEISAGALGLVSQTDSGYFRVLAIASIICRRA